MTDAKDTPAPESVTDVAKKEPNKPSKKLTTSTVKDVVSKGRAMTGSPIDKIEMNPLMQREDANHETTIHTNLSGRFQPPHPGHVKLIKAIEKAANKPGHQAHIVLSHSEGDDKNPIPLKKKKGYVKKLTAPNTQVSSSSSSAPSILHTAARLHQHGHHLVVHAGSDRAAEYEKVLNKYNGVAGPHGHYKFKSITVKPIGRDPDAVGVKGYSGTKVRDAARSGDVESVRKSLPPELHAYAGEITKQIQNVASVEKKKKVAKEEFERAIHEFIIENSKITNAQENALRIKSLKSGIEFETLVDTYAYAYNTAVMAESKTHTPEQLGFAAVNSLIANMFFAEDAPVNSAASGTVRGMGYVSGSPDGDGSNYMSANIADADTKNNIMKGVVDSHVAMHDDGKKDGKSNKSDSVNEDLRQWFKDKWVRMDTKGNIKGDCAREPGEGKPKCLPLAKATAMDKDDRATAARRKRREDPVADRSGKGGKPINVQTKEHALNESFAEACWVGYKEKGMKKKGNKMVPNCVPEAANAAQQAAIAIAMKKAGKKPKNEEVEHLEEKNVPTNPALWSRAKSLAKSKFDVYPSAYANGWASKWYKGKGGGWKSVSESVSEASVLDSPEGQKKLQSVWHRAQRRAISATGDGGVLSSRGYEPGKLNLALKVQKSAYKRIHDKGFHDKPVTSVKEDIDSMFVEKFGKEREAIARSGQEPKDKDLVMRSGDRKTSDKGYRTQAINKQVIEARDKQEYDYEGDMAMSQLRSIMHNAQEICDMLKPNTNLPEWVQSKITLAADYISTCVDYLESNEEDIKEDATQKMKKVKDVAIRMANGKIEMHPPGKSDSSGSGGM
jgi:hypothetical protein